MAVRVISDDLETDLPSEIHSILAATPVRRIGAALGSLWKRPGSYKDLWKLREQALFAAGRLAEFLDGVIEQLHDSIPSD
jgi:adenosylhomocysteine nucleosidase